MMMLRKIDSNGYFVEDVLVESVPTIEIVNEDETTFTISDPSYISVPCQGGFYKPKWDGEKWFEGAETIEIIEEEPTTEEVLSDLIQVLIDKGVIF